jgi:TRAP transporter TAXI family solute receptor
MMVLALASVSSAVAQARLPRAAAEAATATSAVTDGTRAAARARVPLRRTVPAEPSLGAKVERINTNTISIVATGPDATALTIAADLSAVLDDGDGFRILPIAGKGGGQNIRDVRFLKGIDLGIAQINLLGLMQRSNEIGRIDDKISYLAKLFNEEMHVLVRAESPLAGVGDLAGKPVSFGEPGSATQLTARDVFARLGVAPAEVELPQADAIERLRKGEIAASVLVSGKPAPAMAHLAGGEFRLLPLPYAKPLQADYLPATLTAADYPGLIGPGATVDTIAVGTVLFAHVWPKGSERYRRIERFVEAFFPRLAELQKPPRHPKWMETNLSATVPGWTRFPAAEEWLRRNAPAPAQVSREQFERFLASRRVAADDTATPVDREKLFQEFLRWNGTRERR